MSTHDHDRPKMIKQSNLEQRKDWSKATIDRFLGEPDKSYTRRYRRMRVSLYSMHRVEAAERSQAFRENAVKLRARKAAAAKGAETKLRRLLAQVARMEVTVEVIPLDDVQANAIHVYNNFAKRRYDGEHADENSSRTFLDRIMVNYIRHELTQYDHQLWVVAGKSGAVTARITIAKRIFEAIAQGYPALASECQKQMQKREVTNP